MKSKRLGALLVAVVMTGAVAIPAFAADEMTVGRFVQRFAEAQNLDAGSAEIALARLAEAGLRVPAGLDLGKRLTERDVAAIAQAGGLTVRTSRPDAGFDSEQVEVFLQTFAADLGRSGRETAGTLGGETPEGSSSGSNGNGPGFDPYSKGKGGSKGKKKGHRSATEPE
jgi:hypothetical protein